MIEALGSDLGRKISRSRTIQIQPTWVLLAVLILGFGLRLHRLGTQNIWWDEGHAVWTARQSLRQVTQITAHDVHPPLYLWMLHGWMRLVGDSEFAVRYLSVIGGMLTLALTYVVARRLVGRRPAMLATLLIATARFQIWWSQEARMYVWASFWALLSIYFFARLRQNRPGAWWSYVLSSLAAMYTLYLSILVLLLENLFVLVTIWRKPQRRRSWYRWLLAQASIAILYSPWLYMAFSSSRTDAARESFAFYRVWQLYGAVLVAGVSTNLDRYTWLLMPFALLACAGIALLLFDRRQPQRYGFTGWEVGLLLLLPLVIPPLVVYGLSIPRGMFYSPKPEARYLLLFSPLFYILIAGTLAILWLKSRWGRIVTVAGVLLVLGTSVSVLPEHYAGRYLRDEYQTAMAVLATHARPGDAVLLVSGDRYPVFLYYYDRQFSDGWGPQVYLMPQYSTRFTVDNVDAELAPLMAAHDRLWLASLERSLQDPEDLVKPWLDAHTSQVLHVAQGHNDLWLYASPPEPPAAQFIMGQPQHVLDPPAALGAGTLVGYDMPTTEFRPGDVVRPGLYVTAGQDLTLDVRWIHASGQVVEQQSLVIPPGPAGGIVRVMPAFAVYQYTPPGRYTVEVTSAGSAGPVLRIATGQVSQSRHPPAARITTPQQILLDEGQISFLGYSAQPSAHVGQDEAWTMTLFWRAERPVMHDYTVFVHLLGPYNPATGGPVWAQDDGYPLAGGHPTSRWQVGQMIADRHILHIPPQAPPGVYRIEVGMYDASTGERLLIPGSPENRILLGEVEIIAR